MDERLLDGSRVCIVGGGPAGSFAALHLLQQAVRRGLHLEVSIFEPRDFTRPGPAGCNRCAGILSSHLLAGLAHLGLQLPAPLIQADVQGYAVHLAGETMHIARPSEKHRVVSVYRSGGPRLLQGALQPSFDAFLLAQAVAAGARHIPARVREVTWEERPVLHTNEGRFEADFLVLAIGVNSRSPLAPAFGYAPPTTATMAQDEIMRPAAWPSDQVSVYFPKQPGVLFGALIPKGQYLNVSLLGTELDLNAVHEFVDARGIALPVAGGAVTLCGCTPRIAIQPAPCMFGPRWVAVGDAAVVRLYKDGIGSAYHTAERAMTAALDHGISQAAFARHYAPFCRRMRQDNLYGRALFKLWDLTLHTPRLLKAWLAVVRHESALPPPRRLHQRILWGMFSGEESYRTLFWLAMRPRAVGGLLRNLLKWQ